MRILLIAPASGRWHAVGRSRLFGGRVFRFSLLSLLAVAAETPDGHEVVIADEQVQDVPLEGDFDLVGITCMTAAAPRAYDLSRHFRGRGIPVVLGGMHPTLMPAEALAHADAVCAGDAEGVWVRVLADAAAGRLAGIYRGGPAGLDRIRRPPRVLLRSGDYGTLQAVQATRGCPNRCSFCSVSAFHKGSFRRRPVADVAEEIAAFDRRFFVFIDDNLVADRDYARDLFRAIRPLGKVWISQATLDIADDEGLVRAAAESGCIGLFVGIETFSDASLAAVQKGFNKTSAYRRKIEVLHAHGIGVEAGIVLGFDRDGPGVFRRTLRLLDDLGIDMAQISILTPLPGTPFHESMRDRIVDLDWARYDFHHAVFEPLGMSAEDLEAGHDWITRQFYRPWRIARRLARMAVRPGGLRALPYAAAINLAYYGRTVRWRIRGWDPSARRSLRRWLPGGVTILAAEGGLGRPGRPAAGA